MNIVDVETLVAGLGNVAKYWRASQVDLACFMGFSMNIVLLYISFPVVYLIIFSVSFLKISSCHEFVFVYVRIFDQVFFRGITLYVATRCLIKV